MIAETKTTPLVDTWFLEKMATIGEGTAVPFLIVDSQTPSEAGIPLMPQVEGLHDIVFYINSKPAPGASINKEQLISGRLKLAFCLSLHPGAETKDIFFHSAQLKVINNSNQHVYGSSDVKAGKNLSFSVVSFFDPEACDDYIHLLKGKPSFLHVVVTVSFYVNSLQELKRLEIIQPLSKVIKSGSSSDLFSANQIRFVYFDTETEQPVPAPTIVYVDPVRRRKARNDQETGFIVKGNKMGTNLAVLQPFNNLTATQLTNSPAVTLNQAGLGIIGNLVFTGQSENLPVVEDVQSEWFKDFINKNQYWVIPSFKIIDPKLNDNPDTSPFRFLFNQIGMDNMGKPVLEGSVSLKLSASVSKEAENQIKAADQQARIKMIQPLDISVRMEIPYHGQDGEEKVSSVVTQELSWEQDTLSMVFRLTNEWIRICYAAISAMNAAGTSGVKLVMSYCFDGMGKKTSGLQQQLLAQNVMKIASLPVISSNTRSKPEVPTYFNAKSKKLIFGDGTELNFSDVTRLPAAGTKTVIGKVQTGSKINKPMAFDKATILPVAATTKITEVSQNKNLVKRSYLKQVSLDLQFACTKYGTFYQEKDMDGNVVSIGCKEPYKLGEVKPMLYAPLEDVAQDAYKVYQSTQSPNRFLVVPERYVITRYEPGNPENSFQPCIQLYSAIDAENLERSRCLLAGALAPDIPRYELEILAYELKKYTPYTPYISFPGETEHKEVYTWGLPEQFGAEMDSFSVGPVIYFTCSAKIETIITLHSLLKSAGISGLIKTTLSDESEYISEILISLDSVNGPFLNGPLIRTETNGTINLRNGLSNKVQLIKAHAYKGADDKLIVPLEAILQKGGEISIDRDPDRAYVVEYQVEQSQEVLEEYRNYLEDIECQVIFITKINFAKEKVQKLKIRFGLFQNETFETELTADVTVSENMLLMPITDFFNQREVHYTVTVVKEETRAEETHGWNSVSLAENGNIINITTSSIL